MPTLSSTTKIDKKSKKNKRYIAAIALTLTAMIWGIAIPVIKTTVEYIPPLTFLTIRFWVSAILLLPVTIYILKRYKINKKRWKMITISALLGHVLTLIILFYGVEFSTSLTGSIITSLSPIIVGLLAFYLLKDRILPNEIEGTVLAFTGALIIILSPVILTKDANLTLSFLGGLLLLIATTFDALYIIYTKKYISTDKIISPLILIVLAFNIAAVVLTPFGIVEQYVLAQKQINDLETQKEKTRFCSLNDEKDEDIICDEFGCYNKPTPIIRRKSNVSEVEKDSFGFATDGRSVNINDVILLEEVIITPQPIFYVCVFNSVFEERSKTTISIIYSNLKQYFASKAIYGVLYMSILSGIAGYILYQIGLRYIEASEAALYMYLQPVFGIPVAYILLNERVNDLFVLGCLLIAYGIYIAERRKRTKKNVF